MTEEEIPFAEAKEGGAWKEPEVPAVKTEAEEKPAVFVHKKEKTDGCAGKVTKIRVPIKKKQ